MMEGAQFHEESERRLRAHKLRERVAEALARCWPWTVTPEDRAELERLAGELEALLLQGIPPGCEPSWLYRDLGEIESRRGWICTWHGELDLARRLYERAFRSFEAAGLPDKAQQCQDKRAGLATWGSRDPDEMQRRAQDSLAATQEGTLDHCEALLEMAQVNLAANDLFDAENWLRAAEAEVRQVAPQPPSREELLETVFLMPDGTEPPGTPSPFLRLSRIHDLYLGVYGGFATVYQRTNQLQKAEHYSRRLLDLRANEPAPDELNELWRQTRPTMQRFDPATLEILQSENQQSFLEELRQIGGDDLAREMLDHQKTWEEAFKADPFAAIEISAVNPVHIREDLERLDREDEGRPEGAPREDLLDRARALQEKARACGSPPLTAWAQLTEAYLLSRSGRDDEAFAILGQAEETLGEYGDDLKVFLYGLRAEIQARRRDWPAVSATCEQGIDLVEKLRFRVNTPYMQSAYLKPHIRLYTLGVRSSHELGRVDEMLDRADRSKSRALLGYSRLSWTEAPDTKALEEDFAQTCRKIDAASASGPIPAELRERRCLLSDRLLLERIRARRPGPLPDLNLDTIRATLAPDEALLYYYWVSETELLLAVLDREGIWYEIREISPARRELLQTLGIPGRLLKRWLESLSGFLSPPSDCLAGKRRLLISPHRRLHRIPFQALPWEGNVLLRSFAVSYLPNLGSLLLPVSSHSGTGVLAVGSCHYENAEARGLDPLEYPETEAAEVAEIFRSAGLPATVLAGEEARKERLLDLERTGQLSRFACLHLATHGTNVESDSPMDSKLELRDASLSGLEIARWRLTADLVVLGACWSGERAVEGRGLAELPGDEMLGLQAAFFAAGARQILGALWPARDRFACELMKSFHRHRLAGAPAEEALRTATLEYLDSEGDVDLVKRWAPFYLVSVGRGRAELVPTTVPC